MRPTLSFEVVTLNARDRNAPQRVSSGASEALNDTEADPEFANDAYTAAVDKIKGSDVEPTLIKNFGKRIEAGDILNYRDQLGNRY